MYDVEVGEKRLKCAAPFLSQFLTKNGARGTKLSNFGPNFGVLNGLRVIICQTQKSYFPFCASNFGPNSNFRFIEF